jgi:phosphoglucomutase
MSETISPLAGKPLDPRLLVNIPRLVTAYFVDRPDPSVTGERVAFGTSGHRGSAFTSSFNEAHILATTEAICRYRRSREIDGPLFLGIDPHALSEPAFASALEVLAAHGVETMVDAEHRYTPTPVISHAILTHNRNRRGGLADGIVITPSHNPPEDGGFKYNPPHGGPADTNVTQWIAQTANELLGNDLRDVRRIPFARAVKASCIRRHDYVTPYVEDLIDVVDLEAVRASGLRIGIDPLGGAAIHFWGPIIERYGLSATIVNDTIDPTFAFMPADWDGKIRMDCSSPYAMARLVTLRDKFDVAFGNDTDADRHGIVTPSTGLMNPNHYLSASIFYLYRNRPGWRADGAIGKTLVSSGMIDRVAKNLGRRLLEVPVGFKWFVDGLLDGAVAFGGEESAGASFLRRDGSVWTTDKDGIILGLLAAEMTAREGRDPGAIYRDLTDELGVSYYARIDAPANADQKRALANVTPDQLNVRELAGEAVLAVLTKAPGNGQPIGGIKVVADQGWFAARPSGTEEVYKIYAESFVGEAHLRRIQEEAQAIVGRLFRAMSR